MTDKNLLRVAAVVSALAEFTDPVPASMIYLAMGMDIHAYGEVSNTLERTGYAKVTATTILLTEKGRGFAAKINQVFEDNKVVAR